MYIIILFSTDGVPGLRRPDLAEEVQAKHVGILRRYLKRKFDKFPTRYSEALNNGLLLPSYAKQALELEEKVSHLNI